MSLNFLTTFDVPCAYAKLGIAIHKRYVQAVVVCWKNFIQAPRSKQKFDVKRAWVKADKTNRKVIFVFIYEST